MATVLEFLQSLLDDGRSHSTLRVYVAAISSRHEMLDGATVGCHRLVSLFLRGALRLRPPRILRTPAWDLPLVLEAMSSPPFEPLTQIGLKWLSMKVAFLLAITTAKRVGELHALSVADTCLRWNPDGSGVVLWPNVAFLPKVLSRTYFNQPIQLARFNSPSEGNESEMLCPVRALRAYIAATAGIRQSEQLFVCHGGPNRGSALSKQRLSHWVVDTIKHAYVASGRPPAIRVEVSLHQKSVDIVGRTKRCTPGVNLCRGIMDVTGHLYKVLPRQRRQSPPDECGPTAKLCYLQ